MNHREATDQHEPHQSAYRPCHSTETALVRVSNDILTAMDKKQGTMLVLLDLSAAFDTIDHVLMLDRLSHIGVRGTAHKWFSSYLENRYQSVNIQGISSKKQRLRFGVPQGSVLGPFLFTQYTVPIGAICRRHGVNYQLYMPMILKFMCRSTLRMSKTVKLPWLRSKPVSLKYEHGCSHIDLNSMMTKLNLLFLLHPASPR